MRPVLQGVHQYSVRLWKHALRFESIYFALRLGNVLRKNQNMSLKSFSGPVHAEKIRFTAYAGSCLFLQ